MSNPTDPRPAHTADVDPATLPVARPVRRPVPTRLVRVGLLTVAGLLATVFVVAGYIRPYAPDGTPRTMGTHAQLGLAPCNFVVMTGKPCPACGMTTSFALLVRGDVTASLNANWVGTVIAVTWGLLLVWAVVSGVRGRALWVPPGKGELVVTAFVGVFLLLMLGRWGLILLNG